MADALELALSSSSAAQRKNGLMEIRSMGEYGAATMGYHEQAFALLDDREASVQVAALKALGSMGDYGAAHCDAIVAKLTGSSEKEVKTAAIQALGALGEHASAYNGAVEGFLEHQDLDLVTEACIALGGMKVASAAGRLAEKLKHADVDVAVGACLGLGALGLEAEALAGMLGSQEARVRAAAVGAMPKEGGEKHLAAACRLLEDPDVYVRINAVRFITGQGSKAAAHAAEIAKLLGSGAVGVRVAAAAALGGLGELEEAQVEALEAALADAEEDTASLMMSIAGVQAKTPAAMRKPACAAATALGALGSAAARSAPKLAEALAQPDSEVRMACAVALGKLGDAGARCEDQLVFLLDDPQPLVAAAACTALGSIAASTSPSASVAGKMAELVKSPHPALKGSALGGLGNMGEEASAFLEDYVKCFQDSTGFVRAQAVAAVAACGELGQMYAAEVCRLMFDEDPRTRLAAAKALPTMGERGAAFAEEVASLLEDPVPEVRAAGIRALTAFGGEALAEWLPSIRAAADVDPSPEVQAAVREAAGGLKALEE